MSGDTDRSSGDTDWNGYGENSDGEATWNGME